jgi:hypothetical protein
MRNADVYQHWFDTEVSPGPVRLGSILSVRTWLLVHTYFR